MWEESLNVIHKLAEDDLIKKDWQLELEPFTADAYKYLSQSVGLHNTMKVYICNTI